MESVVEICKKVLKRLTTIGYEKEGLVSSGQLIFPSKRDGRRISEQELRQLFIEEFLAEKNGLYYSIETPTLGKYSFTNKDGVIKIADTDDVGQSALIDMSVFKKGKENYSRLLNIEFKHRNATENNISKDLLKLMHEEENGAFVLLLKNTDGGTLINLGETRRGVIDKLVQSFNVHKLKEVHWNGGEDKYIELVILSLQLNNLKEKEPFIRYRKIFKKDLNSIKTDIEDWLKILD